VEKKCSELIINLGIWNCARDW